MLEFFWCTSKINQTTFQNVLALVFSKLLKASQNISFEARSQGCLSSLD